MKELVFDIETGKLKLVKADREIEVVSVVPVGRPIVVSFESASDDEYKVDRILKKIAHSSIDSDPDRKNLADAYVFGDWQTNSWDNAYFPSYTIVAIQYYRITALGKVLRKYCAS